MDNDKQPDTVGCLRCMLFGVVIFLLALALYVVSTPARAQLTFPIFPQPPRGGAICNEEHTLCVVNFADYMTDQLVLGATTNLITAQNDLLALYKAEMDKRIPPKCAKVEEVPAARPPKPPAPPVRGSGT